jgi:hypothetical protein
MYGYPEHTKQSVREKLSTDQKWIEKALIILYKYQTEDEKQEGETVEQNGKGFNYHDAYVLSLYATYLIEGKTLTGSQLEVVVFRLPKYAGQILKYIQTHPDEQFPD